MTKHRAPEHPGRINSIQRLQPRPKHIIGFRRLLENISIQVANPGTTRKRGFIVTVSDKYLSLKNPIIIIFYNLREGRHSRGVWRPNNFQLGTNTLKTFYQRGGKVDIWQSQSELHTELSSSGHRTRARSQLLHFPCLTAPMVRVACR